MNDTTRARLRWRCRRGMKELDVLLARWIEEGWPGAGGRTPPRVRMAARAAGPGPRRLAARRRPPARCRPMPRSSMTSFAVAIEPAAQPRLAALALAVHLAAAASPWLARVPPWLAVPLTLVALASLRLDARRRAGASPPAGGSPAGCRGLARPHARGWRLAAGRARAAFAGLRRARVPRYPGRGTAPGLAVAARLGPGRCVSTLQGPDPPDLLEFAG